MDAIKEECKQNVGNYQMTDEEWELVKANFAYTEEDTVLLDSIHFSKEYVIQAVSRLIDFVAEEPQESNLFANDENLFPAVGVDANQSRVNKDVFLEYLKMFQKVLPNWYKLLPDLAYDFREQLFMRLHNLSVWRNLFDKYREQHGDPPNMRKVGEYHEHPHKWASVMKHFWRFSLKDANANDTTYSFYDSDLHLPRLDLTVKDFCILSGECLRFLFRENEALSANLSFLVMMQEDDVAKLESFDPARANAGIVALEDMMHSGTTPVSPLQTIDEGCFLPKLHWLLHATKKKLTSNERKFVFKALWDYAREFNFSNNDEVYDQMDLMYPARHNQRFKDMIQVLYEYGAFANIEIAQPIPNIYDAHSTFKYDQFMFPPPVQDALNELPDVCNSIGLDPNDVSVVRMIELLEATQGALEPQQEDDNFEEMKDIVCEKGLMPAMNADDVEVSFIHQFFSDYCDFRGEEFFPEDWNADDRLCL